MYASACLWPHPVPQIHMQLPVIPIIQGCEANRVRFIETFDMNLQRYWALLRP